jgi:xylulokinase
VEIVEAEEGAAYGAAILAGVGAGRWSTVDAACNEIVRIAGRTQPQPAAAERMAVQYESYRRMYDAIRSVIR